MCKHLATQIGTGAISSSQFAGTGSGVGYFKVQ
jgi:hypothetical protein